MTGELLALVIAATTIGFFHTLLGPDHYLPFIVMARSRKWSQFKTMWVTVLSGIGHIASSIIIGIAGIFLGLSLKKIDATESIRGELAAWLLIGFGLLYFVWGVRKAFRNRPHTHKHDHIDERAHSHTHVHNEQHLHIHTDKKKNITPWILFTIFFLGPCEPLIPILMYPAAKNSIFGLVIITSVFSLITILTMLGVVMATSFGINLLPLKRLERYTHAVAGATVCFCGISIQFLGL